MFSQFIIYVWEDPRKNQTSCHLDTVQIEHHLHQQPINILMLLDLINTSIILSIILFYSSILPLMTTDVLLSSSLTISTGWSVCIHASKYSFLNGSNPYLSNSSDIFSDALQNSAKNSSLYRFFNQHYHHLSRSQSLSIIDITNDKAVPTGWQRGKTPATNSECRRVHDPSSYISF